MQKAALRRGGTRREVEVSVIWTVRRAKSLRARRRRSCGASEMGVWTGARDGSRATATYEFEPSPRLANGTPRPMRADQRLNAHRLLGLLGKRTRLAPENTQQRWRRPIEGSRVALQLVDLENEAMETNARALTVHRAVRQLPLKLGNIRLSDVTISSIKRSGEQFNIHLAVIH